MLDPEAGSQVTVSEAAFATAANTMHNALASHKETVLSRSMPYVQRNRRAVTQKRVEARESL
jgi:hypothetical protein